MNDRVLLLLLFILLCLLANIHVVLTYLRLRKQLKLYEQAMDKLWRKAAGRSEYE